MKILFLIHEYPPVGGGAGVALQHIVSALDQKGHETAILCCGNPVEADEQSPARIHRIPIASSRQKLSGLRAWMTFLKQSPQQLTRILDEFQPDILNAHFAFPAGWIASRTSLPCPLVTSVIGADIHDPTRRISADNNPLIFRAVKKAFQHSQAVTADSHDLASRTTKLYPDVHPTVVHFGVPPLTPEPTPRSELGIPDDAISLVTLCRLVPRKRLDHLIHALSRIHDLPFHFTILGDGPERKNLETLTQQLKLQSRIQFTGFVTEQQKSAYLGQADLFCLPSEHEGFGLVFLEAMSLGTPVLTTSTGGQVDIIQHGINGFLHEPGADAIAAQLRHILEQPNQLKKLRHPAQERAALFQPHATAKGFLDVFKNVIQ